jgi:hypothetical protein
MPEQLERAEAELLRRYRVMRRAELAWNDHEKNLAGPPAVAKKNLEAWQARAAQWQAEVDRLGETLRRQEAEVRELRDALGKQEAWRDRRGPGVCGILACIVVAILALCTGVVADPLAAALTFVIGVPATAVLAFLYVQNANAVLGQRIESADAELRAAEQGVPPIEKQIQAAEQARRDAERSQVQAQATYAALLKADPFWRPYDEAQTQHGAARHAYIQIRDFLESRLGRLIRCNWGALRDDEFELYLKDVFECLGYAVRLTSAKRARTKGDRGADLIVRGRGHCFAIQAKGYAPDTRVAVDAVRDAHFAMTPWQCDRCAVITNSYLTGPALKDAAEVDCLVIDGASLPSLLRGEHPEFPNLTARG